MRKKLVEPSYFPIRGHKTLREIDDLLADCGVIIHEGCGIEGCATTRHYQRLHNRMILLIKAEVWAALGLTKKKVRP